VFSAGRISRDAADRWAMRWRREDFEGRVELDEDQLWALRLLAGIALTSGPGTAFLHDDVQIRGGRDEVRARRRR
jgi:hypothetical protein